MGEFGWEEVLKQFLDEERAKKVAAGWDGDEYATFEQKDKKQLMLFTRTRFNSADLAASFFDAYKDALKKKYPQRTITANSTGDLEFNGASGNVYFRCEGKECITLEGGDDKIFSQWVKKLGWPTTMKTADTWGSSLASVGQLVSATGARPSGSDRRSASL